MATRTFEFDVFIDIILHRRHFAFFQLILVFDYVPIVVNKWRIIGDDVSLVAPKLDFLYTVNPSQTR